MPLGADVREHVLDLALQLGVERQAQVLAGHGALGLLQLDRLADAVLDDPPLAGHAVQDVVVGELESAEAVAVDADAADDLRREHAVAGTRGAPSG